MVSVGLFFCKKFKKHHFCVDDFCFHLKHITAGSFLILSFSLMACRFLGEINAMWRSPCAGRLTQVIRTLPKPEHGASCRDVRPWMLMKCKPNNGTSMHQDMRWISICEMCVICLYTIKLYNYMIAVTMTYICMPWFRSFGPSSHFNIFQLSLLPPCGCPRWKELQAWWNAGARRGNSFKIRSKAESFAGITFKIYQHCNMAHSKLHHLHKKHHFES